MDLHLSLEILYFTLLYFMIAMILDYHGLSDILWNLNAERLKLAS
jgi:hypothetical protein